MQARFPDISAVNLIGSSSLLPCRSGCKAPDYGRNNILLLHGRDKLTPRAAHGVPPEQEDAQRHSSPHYSEDRLFLYPGNNANPEDPVKGIAASRMQSSNDPQQIAETRVNQMTILDKLKAVHLHILAMEQWNASRLKTCHQ